MSVPWAGKTPRAWQQEALAATMPRIEAGGRGIISAVMGSGKSLLIAEVAARWLECPENRVVLTTPTVALVHQLAGTLAERIGPDRVARRFTEASEFPRDCTIACVPSCEELAQDLTFLDGRILWIADEAHRTECGTMQAAIEEAKPFAVLGLTATPYLRETWRSLSLFQELWFSLSVQRALADRIIVPWRECHLQDEDMGDRGLRIDEACIRMIKRETSGFFGIANAISIDDAEAFAALLTQNGIDALAVHSRLARREIKDRIAGLQAGVGLSCLVHVDLLREGVDLPWLEWICLRRPPRSRVSAVQELGRVIRAYPGKTEAIVLDPRDQMAEFSLSYEAAIGGSALEEEERGKRERKPVEPGDLCSLDPTVALKVCQRWLRAAVRDLEFAGRIGERKVRPGGWRYEQRTERQEEALRKMGWVPRTLPWGPRGWALACLERIPEWRRGDCSDLLDLLFAASPRAGGWPKGELESDRILAPASAGGGKA